MRVNRSRDKVSDGDAMEQPTKRKSEKKEREARASERKGKHRERGDK
jgi:hypothetical protein